METIFTLSLVQNALELGLIYALTALALFISFRILNIADLSTDGCFTLGCAVCAAATLGGHPMLGLFAAMGAGVCCGYVTSFLQTRLRIPSILAGIIVNTGLYTFNLAVMGFSSNLNLFGCPSLFTWVREKGTGTWYGILTAAAIVFLAGSGILLFFQTRLGLLIRAVGDNPTMVCAAGINGNGMITLGLCLSGMLTALSGGLLAQYQKSCDINLGTGMVTIALASLMIGETAAGRGGMVRGVLGAVAGSCLYRIILAAALRMHVPAECLKLVSALIVALALAVPYLKKQTVLYQRLRSMKAENAVYQKELSVSDEGAEGGM